MNILQQADNLKGLPDQALQKELLRPTGAMPSFLVLSELQRRKDMRASYSAMQRQPMTTMAEEFATGLGSADVGKYAPAVRGSLPNVPVPPGQPPMGGAGPMTTMDQLQPRSAQMPEMPEAVPQEQTQNFAGGGPVPMVPVLPVMPGMMNGLSDQVDPTLVPPGMGLGDMGPGGPGGPGKMESMGQMGGTVPGPFGLEIPLSYFDFGSADGATGQGPGGEGVGVGSSTGGIGGNAGDTGEGGAGEGAAGGRVRRGSIGYVDGGGVDDSWMWPSLKRYREMMGITGKGMPDQPSSRPNFRVPNWALPIPYEEQGIPPIGGPGARGLGIGRPYPSMPADYPPAFPRQPGVSVGQSIANRLQGVSPEGIPSATGETGGFPEIIRPGPSGVAPAVEPPPGFVLPQEPSFEGVPQNVGQGPQVSQPPPAGTVPPVGTKEPPPGDAGVGSPRGGSPGGPGGLNIGGEGLENYINQIRGLQMPDRYGEIEGRLQSERDALKAGRSSEQGLALLTAGLGILGGESPFAGVNIGKGAQAGIKQWNDASKEMRLAERDIRTAENQISIAKANRDEKQLEAGIKLYGDAQTKKMQAEELRERVRERIQRSADSAADRKNRTEIMKAEVDSKKEDRILHREQTEISGYARLAKDYEHEATVAANAYRAQATALANPANIMTDQEKANAASELEKLRVRTELLQRQAKEYKSIHEKTLNISTARRNNIPTAGEKRGYTTDGRKLQNGERFINKDGQFGIWKDE